MNKFLQRFFELRDKMFSKAEDFFAKGEQFKKIKRVFRGFSRTPFLCLGIISVILFGLVSLGSGLILKSLSNQRDFSLATVSKAFDETLKQDLFVGPIKNLWPESPDFLLVQKNSLVGISPPAMVSPRVLAQITGTPLPDNEIVKHIVEEGESLWLIAKKYDLKKVETIVWANNLKDAIIQPGQELSILPVDGAVHIVKEGESLGEITEKYKADLEKVLYINEISSPEEIFVKQALIIPDAQLPSSSIRTGTFVSLSTNNFYSLSYAYPYGQCTWWVAQKRAIPAWGNARDWLANAISSGFPVCQGSYCTPQTGAVISVRGSYLGHVGYVERVTEGKVVFSEMNYVGWGTMNYRSLRVGDSRILGYIYKTY